MREPRARASRIGAGFLTFSAWLAASTALAQVSRHTAPPPTAGTVLSSSSALTADGVPHTLVETLAIAYESNPQLTGERAHLRATDENVPSALAGWRPTIVVSGSYGATVGRRAELAPCSIKNRSGAFPASPEPGCSNGVVSNQFGSTTTSYSGEYTQDLQNNLTPNTITGSVTQYLYRGGKTTATTHEAVNSVYAERARLIQEEQTVFTDTVNAYVGVISAEQLLELDRENQQVLGDELRAINDRFRVGELTRTDVAQAEAALAQAIATAQTAEGNLQTARATFERQVGIVPPSDLSDPQPLRLPVSSEKEAAQIASRNNPNVIAALFNQAQQKDAIDVAFSNLGPTLSLNAQYTHTSNQLQAFTTYGATATVNLSLPIYQGGAEYAAVRQARQNYQQAVRQTEDAVRAAREQAIQAWDTLIASRAAIASSRIAVSSARVALEGTERQALIGTATTQDVLIQQQNLLTAQITLVQNITNMVEASYNVANAIGRLTARDLGLAVPLYDETAYYNAVRDRLWGTGDYATKQPGR